MIIDSHAHMGEGFYKEDPVQSFIPAERIVKMAREAGVDKTIVFPVNYPEYSGAMREIYTAVQQFPGELIGYARVNPENDNARAVMRQAIEEFGFKGLKLHPGNDKWTVNSRETRGLLDMARDYGIPALFDPVVQLDDIFALTREYPTLNFIIAHMGGFYDWRTIERCIALAEELPNVYLDTPFAMVHVMIRKAAERIPSKLIFGTDAPAIHPAVELAKIRSLALPEEVEEKILGGNISRVLQLA
jgi:predicted TIM-barrel fold metal-dependent hydrolase